MSWIMNIYSKHRTLASLLACMSPLTYSLLRLTSHRYTSMMSAVLSFPAGTSHCSISTSQVIGFSNCSHNELKGIWYTVWQKKISIIISYRFRFIACFFVEEQRWLIPLVVLLDLSIFTKEKNQSISKTKHIAKRKLEMGKSFAFSLFQHLDLVVSQIEN